jgi:hypothetical protein
MDTTTLLEQLRQPFPPSAISWKPGATKGDKCMALAYADLRAYQERLDELMGLDWSVRYIFWGDNRIACELTLYVGDALGRREGITRSSIGESDAQDEKNNMAGSVSEAMAFKRAAAMFGLGRYLYELPAAWVGFDATTKKISKDGQAELDNRYKTWYTKTMAASKGSATVTQPRIVEPSTGEIVNTAESPKLSDEQRKKLNAIGNDLYGDEWDTWRHTHAEIISNGRTMSSGELTRQEASTLIEKLDMLLRFDDLGQELYADQWPSVCRRNAERVSAGATKESHKLTAEQLQMLIDGMMTVKSKRTHKASAQEPIATVA